MGPQSYIVFLIPRRFVVEQRVLKSLGHDDPGTWE